MSHRIEERDGIHIIHVSGEVTAVESRVHFRTIAEFLHRGPAFILLAYERRCCYLPGPSETSLLLLAVFKDVVQAEDWPACARQEGVSHP